MKRSPKVVGIRGAHPHGLPVQDKGIIAELEGLLKEAKDGNIHGLVYAVVTAQRGIQTAWTGKADSFDMVAAANLLAHRVTATKA